MSENKIDESVFLADGVKLSGSVTIEKDASVWYNSVLRDSGAGIRIGEGSNVQDLCLLHAEEDFGVEIGSFVTVGHCAIVHGCRVGSNTLIGMGACIMNGAVVGENCIIGAGALVTEGMTIPDGSLVIGFPAKVKRQLTEAEIRDIRENADEYIEEAKSEKAKFDGTKGRR